MVKKDEITEAEGTDEPMDGVEAPVEIDSEAEEPVVGADGAHVESVGAGGKFYVWECSEGDFVSRVSPDEVEAHIATAHGTAKPKKAARRG
jgi:hypothetical protein